MFNAWAIAPVKQRDETFKDMLLGPGPLDWGPNFVTTKEPFRPSDMKIADLFAHIEKAKAFLPTATPGEVTSVDAAQVSVLGKDGLQHRWAISLLCGTMNNFT